MSKADTYKFLLDKCKETVVFYSSLVDDEMPRLRERLRMWQACVDLLEEEKAFHCKLLEGRA